jgi:transcription elongation factor Elf1
MTAKTKSGTCWVCGALQAKIATDSWPDGAVLSCSMCGHSVDITPAQGADYLAQGWPQHCGQTMTLAKKAGGA